VRTGAAAIVGDERIAVSTLGQDVRDWQREFRADPRANDIRSQSGEPMGESAIQNALFLLVQFRVFEEAARRAGVPVTEGQADQALTQIPDAPSVTRAQGLPARYARHLARWQVARVAIPRTLGNDSQRIETLLRQTVRSLDIQINPRYGTFDAERGVFGPARTLLSRPESGLG
jgi:hypothetical protein